MSGGPPVIDDGSSVLPDLITLYADQELAVSKTSAYLTQNCTLDGAFGLLLSFMKPRYENGRDLTMSAVKTIEDTINTTRQYVVMAADDLSAAEKGHEESLEDMIKRIVDQELAAQGAGGTGGSGGSGVGGSGVGGGGFGGGGGMSMPTMPDAPPATTPTAPAPEIHVDVTVDGDGNVDVDVEGDGNVDVDVNVEGDGNVDVDVNGEDVDTPDTTDDGSTDDGSTDGSSTDAGSGAGGASAAGAGTPDPASTGAGPGATADGSPTLEDGTAPPLSPDDQAKEAALYHQLWEERAAHDPLGRSADELRLAWEEREPLAVDPDAIPVAVGIGYGPQPPAFRVSLGLMPQQGGAR